MSRLRRLFRKLSAGLIFLLLVVMFAAAMFFSRIFIIVPAGYEGVMWYMFLGGTAHSKVPLKEGLHVILPWDRIYLYEERLQSQNEVYDVISADGLQFKLTLSFRWRSNPNRLSKLHQDYGPDYLERLLVPEVGAVTRGVIARYDAVDLVGERRTLIAKEIYGEIVDVKRVNGIGQEVVTADPGVVVVPAGRGTQSNAGSSDEVVLLRDVLITSVDLPEQIQKAIKNKLEMAQIVEEYKLRVERERLESERKAVEAEGVRKFQETVTPAISESYLKWRGIEATLQLAQSPNSKVVVIGNGPSGLPIILDTADGKSGPPADSPVSAIGKDAVKAAAGVILDGAAGHAVQDLLMPKSCDASAGATATPPPAQPAKPALP